MSKHSSVAFPICGYLWKLKHKPGILGSAWNKRYFVVEERRNKFGVNVYLAYYPDESKTNDVRESREAILLQLVSHVSIADGAGRLQLYVGPASRLDERSKKELLSNRDLVFEVETTDRVYFLRADSRHEMIRWVAGLQRMCAIPVDPPLMTTWPADCGSPPAIPPAVIEARIAAGTLPNQYRHLVVTEPAAATKNDRSQPGSVSIPMPIAMGRGHPTPVTDSQLPGKRAAVLQGFVQAAIDDPRSTPASADSSITHDSRPTVAGGKPSGPSATAPVREHAAAKELVIEGDDDSEEQEPASRVDAGGKLVGGLSGRPALIPLANLVAARDALQAGSAVPAPQSRMVQSSIEDAIRKAAADKQQITHNQNYSIVGSERKASDDDSPSLNPPASALHDSYEEEDDGASDVKMDGRKKLFDSYSNALVGGPQQFGGGVSAPPVADVEDDDDWDAEAESPIAPQRRHAAQITTFAKGVGDPGIKPDTNFVDEDWD